MTHLVVMCHGLWGGIDHFDYIIQQLCERGVVSHDGGPLPSAALEKPANLVIAYRTHSSKGYFTYDGIDVCGTRVAEEINAEVKLLAENGIPVHKISLMGYSMGGLCIRYAVGILETQGLFNTIEPCSITTLYSPHLGARALGTKLPARIFNFVGSWSMARTSRQMFLMDRYEKSGTPLFLHMCEPGTPYMRGLSLFKRRVLYANIVNDRRCAFYTSAIETSDPFMDKDAFVAGPYVPGYKPLVMDGRYTPKFKTPAECGLEMPLLGKAERPSVWQRAFKILKTVLKLVFVLPMWFVAFLVNASWQALFSTRRTFSIIKSGKHIPEYAYEKKSTGPAAALLEHRAVDLVNSMYGAVENGNGTSLIMTEAAIQIAHNLNKGNWEKFFVHVKDKNAHAVAIVRHPHEESHKEGRMAVLHWIDKVLLDTEPSQ